MEAAEFTGEHLLDLFDTLGIQLANLNPNVIKGWFDTDCKDTKDCIKWMCASITYTNLLPAQETIESAELEEAFLVGNKYESSLAAIEEKFPGIFDDPEEVQLEIELLEDERELYSDELNNLEYIFSIQEKVHEKVCTDLHKLKNEEIAVKLTLDKAKENCESLAKRLDVIDIQLLEQVTRYASYLSDFEFSSEPQFIHSMPVYTCEENFYLVSGYLNTFLKRECGQLLGNLSDDKSVFSENSYGNLALERINVIKNRIFNAKQRYFMEKFKVEEILAVIQMLNSYNSSTSLLNTYNVNYSTSLFDDCAQLEMSIDSKKEQTLVMMEMIQSTYMKQAEYEVSQPMLCFAQKELEAQQLKLDNSKHMHKNCSKLLATYIEMNMLFLQENKDITGSDEFFKQVLKYITKDLQMCILRTEAMSQIIEEFKHFDAKPVVHQLKIVSEIMKHIMDKKGFENIEENTLKKAVALRNSLEQQLSCGRQQFFYNDIALQKEQSKEVKEEITVRNNFLMCGPTSRIEAIPSQLFNIFRETDAFVENQNIAVKSVVDIIGSTSKTLAKEKWLKDHRHLWMYFLNDHTKLFAALKSIEDEYNNLKVTS